MTKMRKHALISAIFLLAWWCAAAFVEWDAYWMADMQSWSGADRAVFLFFVAWSIAVPVPVWWIK